MAPKFIPFKDVEQLADIEQLASMLNLQLRRYGASGQLRCVCPVHGGDDDALAISPGVRSRRGSMGVFFCRPGQSGGDRIGLVAHCMEFDGKNPQQDAAFFIASQFGIDIEDDGTGHSTTTNNSSATVPPAQQKAPQKVAIKPPTQFDPVAFFKDKLAYSDEVAAFGFSEEDAEHFQVGCYKGHVYGPLRHPDGSIACYWDYTDGKMKFPARQRWLEPSVPNVVAFPKRA